MALIRKPAFEGNLRQQPPRLAQQGHRALHPDQTQISAEILIKMFWELP
jgi:hypothetical protein